MISIPIRNIESNDRLVFPWNMLLKQSFLFFLVPDIRFKEKKLLVSLLFMQAVNMSMAMLLTSIAAVATFAAHIAFGNNLTVSEVSLVIRNFFEVP